MNPLRSTGSRHAARASCKSLIFPLKNCASVSTDKHAGAMLGSVAARDRRRFEMRAQHAFAGTGFLDLGNHRRLPAATFAAQAADEIARRRRGSGLCLHHGRRFGRFARATSSALTASMRCRMSAM